MVGYMDKGGWKIFPALYFKLFRFNDLTWGRSCGKFKRCVRLGHKYKSAPIKAV